MFPISLPPSHAYLAFVLLAFALYCGLYLRLPERREQMNWMGLWGSIGGIILAQWYRVDFGDPPSIYSLPVGGMHFTAEDFVWGGSFAGIMTVLMPSTLAGGRLEVMAQGVTTKGKILVPLVAACVSVWSHQFWHWNSVESTALGFAMGSIVMCFLRPDLAWSALGGGFLTTLTLMILVDIFIIGAANMNELIHLLCQYCRTSRFVYTLDILLVWAFACGMLFTPFYLFVKNLQVVPRES